MANTNFGKAFKAARAAGKKEFTFGGKKYHTRTAEEEAKRAPAAKPSASKPSTPKADPMARAKAATATRIAAAQKPAPKPASKAGPGVVGTLKRIHQADKALGQKIRSNVRESVSNYGLPRAVAKRIKKK